MLSSVTRRFLKQSSGMTLLEVLVSMLLIGSALGMSLSMIQSSLQFERNALRTGIFIDAVDEFASLSRSNKICASSYAFDGFTVDANGRAQPRWVESGCNGNGYANTALVSAAHNRARTDVSNWLSDLIQHFPQGDRERRQTTVTYNPTLNTLNIVIRYIGHVQETEALAENLENEYQDYQLNYSVQL